MEKIISFFETNDNSMFENNLKMTTIIILIVHFHNNKTMIEYDHKKMKI